MPQIPADFLLANARQLSIYTMKGCDKVILRRKGGASCERIKTEPNFANTRRVNAEFGGRATCSKWIRRMLRPLGFIADYNITGPLNALLKPIQELDTINDYGERSVALSANPHLLEGFNLNKRSSFDAIVHNPVRYTLSKRKGHASITIPAVLPGHNFVPPGNFAMYRFIVLLGIIPDLFFTPDGYRTKGDYDNEWLEDALTEWFPVQTGSSGITLELQLPQKPANNAYSIILTIGVAFGALRNGDIEPIQYMGGAKILGVE
ncbi:MAG TPA: hypothetical protein VF008_01305 [Niastella sp.]